MAKRQCLTRVTANGRSYDRLEELEADGVGGCDPSIQAAKAGTLTVRTDNDTGTIVMGSGGHGIGTGNKIHVYWEDPTTGVTKCHRTTAGTVAGTSVPVDTGVGDNLPLVSTAVRVCKCSTENLPVVGNDLVSLVVSSGNVNVHCVAELLDADGTTIHLAVLNLTYPTYIWTNTNGVTNPIAGDTVVTVRLSHDDTTQARRVTVDLIRN